MLIWVQSTLVVLFRVIFNFGIVIAVYIAVFVSTGTISDAAVFHVNRLDKIQNTLPRLVHRVVVFGKDTRKKLPKKYKYFNKYIGHLHYRRGRSTYNCTASCIAPDIIGTAAHCLFEPDCLTSSLMGHFKVIA